MKVWNLGEGYMLTDRCTLCGQPHSVALLTMELHGYRVKCGQTLIELEPTQGKVPPKLVADVVSRYNASVNRRTHFVTWEDRPPRAYKQRRQLEEIGESPENREYDGYPTRRFQAKRPLVTLCDDEVVNLYSEGLSERVERLYGGIGV